MARKRKGLKGKVCVARYGSGKKKGRCKRFAKKGAKK